MITLRSGKAQYECSILQVLQNGILFNKFNWNGKEGLVGSISIVADIIPEVIHSDFIYIEKLNAPTLNKILNKNKIQAVFTKSTLPISITSAEELPYVFTVPIDAQIIEEDFAALDVDFTGYSICDFVNLCIIYYNELDLPQLHSRLLSDFNAVETYLELKPANKINVVFARDLNDLFSFTGQKSTFAYQNNIMGLIYKIGKYRPDIHEYTHILLYKLGKPPFIFLEGMATLTSDLVFAKDNSRKSFDVLAGMFLQGYSNYSLEDLFTVNYSSENYHIHMYYISASFVYYLIRNYGLDLVKTCYMNISRRNALAENLEVFGSIIGKSLETVQKEWLITLGK